MQLAAGGVLGAAAGCGVGGAGAVGDPGGGADIRVGVFPQNHAASPLFWSRFAPPGVRVRVRPVSSGSDMNVALQRGDLDFAVFGLVNGFVQHQEGIESKIICMAAQRGAALVVARDSPHRVVADLAGRRIGFKGPAFQYLLLLELLDAAGMDPERDVSLVPVEWNQMPAALARGDVEAYMGTEPNPSRSVADGTGRRLLDPYTTPAGSLNSAVWASPRMLGQRPDLCRAACEMQFAAADLLSPGGRNDPAVWRELTVEQFGYEQGVYEALLPNVGAVGEFDDAWRRQADAQARRMVSLGLITEEPGDAVFDLSHQPA
jgi:ABC-type nitrate/sulfonate/bicarbonate transport system substrate-binding protein